MTNAINITENKNEYIVYIAYPGMLRQDFHLKFRNGKLYVTAFKRKSLHCFDKEKSQKPWKQTIQLPENADPLMTAAVYQDGELQIHIPKGESATGTTVYQSNVFVY